jgi:outer membrane protein TolC
VASILRFTFHAASCAALCLAGLAGSPLAAQTPPPGVPAPTSVPPSSVRITLQEAKERALANNKPLNLDALNVETKGYAVRAIQADYFPKITGSVLYLHFNDFLGTHSMLEGGAAACATREGGRGRAGRKFEAAAPPHCQPGG